MEQIAYFLGANTPQGFYSLTGQMLDPDKHRAIYILKGGAGCGKSTLMKHVAKRMTEAGERVEHVYCSGDPDSLDALLIPGKQAAIVDGTAPQGVGTKGHSEKRPFHGLFFFSEDNQLTEHIVEHDYQYIGANLDQGSRTMKQIHTYPHDGEVHYTGEQPAADKLPKLRQEHSGGKAFGLKDPQLVGDISRRHRQNPGDNVAGHVRDTYHLVAQMIGDDVDYCGQYAKDQVEEHRFIFFPQFSDHGAYSSPS